MADLVTLDQAKMHLRVDSDDEDLWIQVFISAISGAVIAWLKDEWRAYVIAVDADGNHLLDSAGDPYPLPDANGDFTVKPMVVAAVLVELSQQYRFRDGSGAAAVLSHWGHGYTLGAGATSLLTPLRKSTVA
jgi:hypothetical protein